jgi:hypothetical protein
VSTEIVHLRNETEAAMLRVLIKGRENFVPRLHFYPFARLEILNFVFPNFDGRGLAPDGPQPGDEGDRNSPKRGEEALTLYVP